MKMSSSDLHHLIRIICVIVLGGLGIIFLLIIKAESGFAGLLIGAVCVIVAGEIATKIEDWIKKPERR